ncbi:ABC transporter permease [Cuneatibacter sp. NSJ-177]|uniref:ABC transporter permease n=1 Tax=Cuneatibacter sp. NSJ-177 TaxID=2931401 RepID=UPI001FD36971|nr:ABC transporter permease [Cuneatibacter sp. NSJ-177]MCJ7837311.1 ABC transporter permease [Cuneatibacter sp. NSJ-177]
MARKTAKKGKGAPANAGKKESMLALTWKQLIRNKMAVAGLILIGVMAILAILAPVIAPYAYDKQDLYHTFLGPCREHWFGTDNLGRDIFSRILYGARYSLSIGIAAVAMSLVAGVSLGALCGFYGGKLDMILMRVLDVFQSIPGMLMAIAVSATLGPGLRNCIIALSISSVPGYARMMRASMLNIRDMEYVEAARSVNARDGRIIFRHMIPNAMAPTIVQATMGVATAILVAASLSFIGLGVQPPAPEWGAMLADGRNYIRDFPHLVMFPGIAIMLAVLSLNMLGDGLRDALDPRLKN